MSVIVASLQGRFGNQVLTWLFCRALAERTQSELRVEPWIGERVFQTEQPRPDTSQPIVRLNAIEALQWTRLPFEKKYDIEVRDYCQHQPCMIYTKREAQSWLRFRGDIETACLGNLTTPRPVVGHLRRGDYAGYGYPLVSERSYFVAAKDFGLDPQLLWLVSEETAVRGTGLPDFLLDFYLMCRAKTLLRANSTMSWLAALLGESLVLAPVIDGLEGGKEHHCKFVAGNHPRLANFDFTTDLYISP